MTKLLIQHGPAKGQKIQVALENKNSEGVIFAPREETIEAITSYCNSIPNLNKDNTYIRTLLSLLITATILNTILLIVLFTK